MNIEFSHLTKKAVDKLSLSNNDRVYYIKKPRWIGYSKAQDILNKLEDLYHYPQQSRMPNMLIIGETNNGKTVLVNKFREKHPPDKNLEGENIILPILYVQAPPSPDERGLYNSILNKLFEPYGRSESTDTKRERVISILSRIDLRMIMIDEFQHLLAGSYTKQRNYLNALKYLGNELGVPLVGVGTAEALRAVQTDPQLANRFTPEILPKWQLDEEFLRLLATFESLIPLKYASNLTSAELATHIHMKSCGVIGEISTLLIKASEFAIKNKIEKINIDVLNNCGFISPDQRKKVANLL